MFLLAIVTLFSSDGLFAQEKTILSVEVYGYKGDMIYFDCVQTPLIRQEFYTNPGEEHHFAFSTDELVCMLINGKTKLLMQRGDSLHAVVRYDGRNIDATYSGSENAVKANNLLKSIDNLKRDMRYRSQLLGCVALDIKPKNRIDDSRVLLARAAAIVDAAGVSSDVASYILAGIESEVYLSFIEYPVMYASVRGVPVEKQEIGDYHSIADSIKIRSDKVSLSNPEYISMLMRYCFYMDEIKAENVGQKYTMPTRFEDMYARLAAFYEGNVKDAVLYTLLCNFIKNGQEIERADALYKDYRQNHNKNPEYIKILDAILQ